jgi:hypothetical protein
VTTALCVFAVCRTGTFTGLPEATGHPQGGPVALLAIDDRLSAVVQEVPAGRFTEEALKERLSDPAELESCARAHHAVVTAAAAHGSVVPLPLATLFTDADRARSALSECLPRFGEALARVQDRAEWAIKVYQRQAGRGPATVSASTSTSTLRVQTPSPGPATSGGGAAAPGAGRAYLARVRDRESGRRDRRDTAVAAAGRVHQAACAAAADCVQRRPHGQDITGRDRLQVMNAAYLVDRERAAGLRAAVDALAGELAAVDVEVEVSGPWVPYSFTEPPDAVAARGEPGRGGA